MKCHLLVSCLLVGMIGASEEKTDESLADLGKRVQKLLTLQTEVNDRTKELPRAIQSAPNKLLRPEDQTALRTLAARQQEVMDEADRCIILLEKDGSVVAFVEVFQEVRKDMDCLHRRLKAGDAGPDSQAIGREITEILKELLEALTRD